MWVHRITAGLAAAIFLATVQVGGALAADRPFVDGEVLVKYRQADNARRSLHYRAMWGINTARTYGDSGVRKVKLPASMTVAQAVALYRDDPDVEYAEPNYRYRLQALPDDAYMDRLWGLYNTGQEVNGSAGTADADIDAERAWNVETGSRRIVVAVVDSGIDTDHPDLAANLWTNTGEIPANGIDDDGNGYVDDVNGWDFANGNNDPMDSHGHGTHVAGIIGAVGDNGMGVTGVCWRVHIMPLRFISAADYGTAADAIDAIQYADANGADVINLSWGGGNYSAILKNAIDAANALVVCAAGNDGDDLDASPMYPASYDSANILSVGATDADDHPTWHTNFSDTQVDVAAPGSVIFSTVPDRLTLIDEDFADLTDWQDDGSGNWGLTAGAQTLSESPAGDYANGLNTWIRLAALDLSGRRGARLDFRITGATAGAGDYLLVEASTDGSSWSAQPIGMADGLTDRLSGTIAAWQTAIVELKAFDGMANLRLRLRFVSDGAGRSAGFRIDDLAVTCADSTHGNDSFAYYSGTSMSAAYASGVAALLMAGKPSLLPTEIRLVMESTVDVKTQLIGLNATAGRINAYRALMSVAAVDLSAHPASRQRIDLRWTTSLSGPSGFEIQRRPAVGADYDTIAIMGAGDATYTDGGLDDGATYVYRVLTLSGSERTGYSNEASATTSDVAGESGGGGGGGGCFVSSMADRPVDGSAAAGAVLGALSALLALSAALARRVWVSVRRTGG